MELQSEKALQMIFDTNEKVNTIAVAVGRMEVHQRNHSAKLSEIEVDLATHIKNDDSAIEEINKNISELKTKDTQEEAKKNLVVQVATLISGLMAILAICFGIYFGLKGLK